jgi:hypothetical protein
MASLIELLTSFGAHIAEVRRDPARRVWLVSGAAVLAMLIVMLMVTGYGAQG